MIAPFIYVKLLPACIEEKGLTTVTNHLDGMQEHLIKHYHISGDKDRIALYVEGDQVPHAFSETLKLPCLETPPEIKMMYPTCLSSDLIFDAPSTRKTAVWAFNNTLLDSQWYLKGHAQGEDYGIGWLDALAVQVDNAEQAVGHGPKSAYRFLRARPMPKPQNDFIVAILADGCTKHPHINWWTSPHITHGFDFVHMRESPDPVKTDMEGTAFSSVIASIVDNGMPLAGIAPTSQVMCLKVTEDGELSEKALIAAMKYVNGVQNVKVILHAYKAPVYSRAVNEVFQKSPKGQYISLSLKNHLSAISGAVSIGGYKRDGKPLISKRVDYMAPGETIYVYNPNEEVVSITDDRMALAIATGSIAYAWALCPTISQKDMLWLLSQSVKLHLEKKHVAKHIHLPKLQANVLRFCAHAQRPSTLAKFTGGLLRIGTVSLDDHRATGSPVLKRRDSMRRSDVKKEIENDYRYSNAYAIQQLEMQTSESD